MIFDTLPDDILTGYKIYEPVALLPVFLAITCNEQWQSMHTHIFFPSPLPTTSRLQ